MTTHAPYDLRPKTRPVPASTLRRGHVILESWEHPARITRVRSNSRSVYLHALYVWQRPTETPWPLGPWHPDALVEKAV